MSPQPETLYDKIWRTHTVVEDDGETILYVDLHLLHEATSSQAFTRLSADTTPVRRPELVLAVADHCVPTKQQSLGLAGIADEQARAQVAALTENSLRHGIEMFELGDPRNGIAHVVAPEQGRTHPGMTIVCGDSHTSTHGAFGALAFGIGTSEVQHVLATQTIRQRKAKNFRIQIDGATPPHVGAKDIALFVLSQLGADGARGYVVEYAGDAVRALSMEGRMTLCNMSVELGATAGMIAPDECTIAYLAGRPSAPSHSAFQHARDLWLELKSDEGAVFDREVTLRAEAMAPMVSWGTNPSEVVAVTDSIPDLESLNPSTRASAERALAYMGLEPGGRLLDLPIDRVFIGSCTNGRIEDLRAAAEIVRGGRIAPNLRAMVVPGSGLVKLQAEREQLNRIFVEAGWEWREPGCSMCVAMNDDRLGDGERCAATSNRNFENRQGRGGRTHLMSPAMAAAAAMTGRITDVRKLGCPPSAAHEQP